MMHVSDVSEEDVKVVTMKPEATCSSWHSDSLLKYIKLANILPTQDSLQVICNLVDYTQLLKWLLNGWSCSGFLLLWTQPCGLFITLWTSIVTDMWLAFKVTKVVSLFRLVVYLTLHNLNKLLLSSLGALWIQDSLDYTNHQVLTSIVCGCVEWTKLCIHDKCMTVQMMGSYISGYSSIMWIRPASFSLLCRR